MQRTSKHMSDASAFDPDNELFKHAETITLRRDEPLREWKFQPRIRVEPGTDISSLTDDWEEPEADYDA